MVIDLVGFYDITEKIIDVFQLLLIIGSCDKALSDLAVGKEIDVDIGSFQLFLDAGLNYICG